MYVCMYVLGMDKMHLWLLKVDCMDWEVRVTMYVYMYVCIHKMHLWLLKVDCMDCEVRVTMYVYMYVCI